MMRHRLAARPRFAEDVYAQPANRRGNPVAVQIQLIARWRNDRSICIHLHAIDDRNEIVLLQIEF